MEPFGEILHFSSRTQIAKIEKKKKSYRRKSMWKT